MLDPLAFSGLFRQQLVDHADGACHDEPVGGGPVHNRITPLLYARSCLRFLQPDGFEARSKVGRAELVNARLANLREDELLQCADPLVAMLLVAKALGLVGMMLTCCIVEGRDRCKSQGLPLLFTTELQGVVSIVDDAVAGDRRRKIHFLLPGLLPDTR